MLSETPQSMEGVGGGDAASMEEAPSPVQPQETPAANGAPSADSGAPEPDTGPYQFEGWEDAANHLAELIGLEYDAQIAAGVDPLKARSQAYHDILEGIFEDQEDPALAAALEQYLPWHESVPMDERTGESIPEEEFGPRPFLVRAGRLPPLALKAGSFDLPNGERYYFDDDEEVVVIWQTRGPAPADTEEGRQTLAELEKRREQWETKLAHDPGNTEAQEALEFIETSMSALKTPELIEHREELRSGLTPDQIRNNYGLDLIKTEDPQPSSPDVRLTVLRLGVIDE